MNDFDWGKIGKICGLLVTLGTIVGGVIFTYEYVTTDAEAAEIVQHHEDDMADLYERLIQQERKTEKRLVQDQIARNDREISRLQRDLLGKKYADQDERDFIVQNISRLMQENDALRKSMGNEFH